MLSSEQILEGAAQDGSIDIAEWPRVLETVLQRLRDIVYNDFPIPSIPPPAAAPATIDPEVVASTPPQLPPSDPAAVGSDVPSAENEHGIPSSSQDSLKENDAPKDMAAGRPPSLPAYPPGYEVSQSQQTEEMPTVQPEATEASDNTLPPELLHSYQYTERMLKSEFSESPPYTIQRLAELVLHPKKHYRFLPAYLRALDHVVAVSSPVSDFPLPALHASTNGGFLTNGEAQTHGIGEREGLGSDESLGGALLTPIPWLRSQTSMLSGTPMPTAATEGELHSESTDSIEGPHGAGSIETVSVTVNGIPSTSVTLAAQSANGSFEHNATSPAVSTEAQLREQGGLTQGELLRKEQEAGIVPVDELGQPLTSARTLRAAGAVAVGRESAEDHPLSPEPMLDDTAAAAAATSEELPHARGPEVIGMEDMGPQAHPVGLGAGVVLDMEAAVGRGRSKSPQPQPPPPPPDSSDAAASGADGEVSVADDAAAEPPPPAAPQQEQQQHGAGDGEGAMEVDVEKLKDGVDGEATKDVDGDVELADAAEPQPADRD